MRKFFKPKVLNLKYLDEFYIFDTDQPYSELRYVDKNNGWLILETLEGTTIDVFGYSEITLNLSEFEPSECLRALYG